MLTGDVPFVAETQVGVAMRHVNEPMPDVQARRPDVSAALALVIDRATTKDPHDRYGSVAEMVRDLEATLEVEAARRGGTTGEATSVLDSVPPSQRRLAGRRVSGAGIAMGVIGLALIAAALVFGGQELNEIGDEDEGGGAEVNLSRDSADDFDPFGTSGEHPEETSLAIDGDPTGTAWSTESYAGTLPKDGVGIYVDAGREVDVSAVELRFGEAGEDVEIRAAPGVSAAPEDLEGWKVIGQASDVGTRVRIDTPGAEPSRFYLVWLTKLPESGGNLVAEISDIRLLGRS
jgi:eukaryotic-like serine/threonine-protein kinase